jgi:hypothetical protein
MLTTTPFPQRVAASVCVRENLPQSFHSLAVSEPDPITLFTPYILSVLWLSNDHAMLFKPRRPKALPF